MVSVFKTTALQKLALFLSPGEQNSTLLDPLGRAVELFSKPSSSTQGPNRVDLCSSDDGNKPSY
jgi:hypothetical protein